MPNLDDIPHPRPQGTKQPLCRNQHKNQHRYLLYMQLIPAATSSSYSPLACENIPPLIHFKSALNRRFSKPQILRPLIDSTLNSSTACPLFRMHIISTRWLLRLSTTRLVIFSGRLSPISLSYASRKVLCRYKGGPIAGDLRASALSSGTCMPESSEPG